MSGSAFVNGNLATLPFGIPVNCSQHDSHGLESVVLTPGRFEVDVVWG